MMKSRAPRTDPALPAVSWQEIIEADETPRTQRFSLLRDGRPATYGEVIEAWATDGAFREFFNEVLARSEFPAFRWETPPVTESMTSRKFEFVLLSAAALDRPIDRHAFAEHFAANVSIVEFENRGGDARLVVPCPIAHDHAYGHLASFVREAPAAQRDELWRVVGLAMTSRLGEDPVWLSTAGMGVSWLHVRLDSRPKYFGYTPYRTSS